MPRLALAQDDARRRIDHLAAGHRPPAPLGQALIEAVAEVVPGDGWRLFAVDPATLLLTRTLAASASDPPARREWLAYYYLREELRHFTPRALLGGGIRAAALHDVRDQCWGVPTALREALTPGEHRRRYHADRTPTGGVLYLGLAAGGRPVGVLQLYRRGARGFRPGEVAFAGLVAPTIGRGLAAALRREAAEAGPTGDAAAGVLVVDSLDRLHYATPQGEAWLRLLHDDEGRGHAPWPTAIWAAVAQLRADPARAATGLIAPSGRGPVRVEATAGGADGSVAVVLTPERPPAPPEIPADWPLSRQERRIVALVLRGGRNREIAARLSISENTIEWHLRRVYEKLGVGGRTELVGRFFRESFLPAFRDADDPGAGPGDPEPAGG